MKVVGILMNFADKDQRATYPTGLLLFFKETKQLLATSKSPLSNTLKDAFQFGIRFTETDELLRRTETIANGKDPARLIEKAAIYYGQSGYLITSDELDLPLAEDVFLTEGLKFTTKDAAFETLSLKGLT